MAIKTPTIPIRNLSYIRTNRESSPLKGHLVAEAFDDVSKAVGQLSQQVNDLAAQKAAPAVGPAAAPAVAPTGAALIPPSSPSGGGASSSGLTIGFVINSGTTGTNVGPGLIAPAAGTISKCKIYVKASDPTTDLTFKINQNGTDVFSTDPTVVHGTAAGTLVTVTTLTSVPLSVAADDIFTIDITSGTGNWEFTAQLET